MPNLPSQDFIYIFDNFVPTEIGKCRAVYLCVKLHLFYMEYAKQFVNVYMPFTDCNPQIISCRKTRLIGKSMQTHETFFKQAIKGRINKRGLARENILALKDMFLFGGTMEVIGTRRGYVNEDIFNAPDNDEYYEDAGGQVPIELGTYEYLRTENENDLDEIRREAEYYFSFEGDFRGYRPAEDAPTDC